MVVLLVACGSGKDENHKLTQQEKLRQDSLYRAALKVGVMPTTDCLPLFVAKECGMFDSVGVDVRLKMFRAQMDCDTALAGSSVEGSVSDLVRVARLQKQGVKVQPSVALNTYWQIVANRLSRVKQIAQLSDKMIAITRNSATDLVAQAAIDSAKPKYDVYKIQINDVKVRLNMLINNELDAAMLTEPQATEARAHDNPVLYDTRGKDLRLGVLAFRWDKLSKNGRQKQYDNMVKAYNEAVDSINSKGVAHYADVLKKYCGCNEMTIQRLPKLHYEHAAKPRLKDLEWVAKMNK